MLLTTQYLDEADRLADRIAVIDTGRVIADGTADQLKDKVGGVRVEVHVTDPATADAAGLALVPMSDDEPLSRAAGSASASPARRATIMEAARRLDQAGLERRRRRDPPPDARRRLPDPDRPRAGHETDEETADRP